MNLIEKKYMSYYWEYQKKQYENYLYEKHHDLNLIDEKIYQIASENYSDLNVDNRRDEIVKLTLIRDMVDKNPKVAKLRNKLDDWNHYNQDIDNQNPFKYRIELARKMKEDVLDLMNLRNKISQDMMFHHYPELMFHYNEISQKNVVEILQQFLNKHLINARSLIKKYNITHQTWFTDLNHLSTNQSFNSTNITSELFNKLGLEHDLKDITIEYHNQFMGLETIFSPNDIHLSLRPITSLNHLRTLFHELGHAIHHLSINDKSGMNMVLTPIQSETMAVVFEYIAPHILLDEKTREKIYDLNTLEYTRCAISALFELALWENPHKAEDLYIQYYSQLGFDINYPEIWSIDSFRSIDPVYIHHYVIGATLALEIINFLKEHYQNDYQCWCDWLVNHCFKEGRMLKMDTLLKQFKII